MENKIGGIVKEDNYQMDLPPGFRFHPTDEELISHYLSNKVLDTNFCCRAIADVDLNKSEPWDLPCKTKNLSLSFLRLYYITDFCMLVFFFFFEGKAKMGEKEWYFFSMRDRKYPTGLRTNRATQSGYWKATGKDKEIFNGKTLVGMKKTLVFYGGRAPKGEKSNWVMHEFRLDGQISSINLPNPSKNEWVISRVFQKSCGKRVHISDLPPLKDSSFSFNNNNKSVSESIHVPCFSNTMNSSSQRTSTRMADYYSPAIFPRNTQPTSLIYHPQAQTFSLPYLQFPSSVSVQDQAIVRGMIEKEKISVSQETGLSNDLNNEISSVVSNLDMGHKPFDDQEAPSASIGPLNPHNFWNY